MDVASSMTTTREWCTDGISDAYVAKLDASGALVWATYLGGDFVDIATADERHFQTATHTLHRSADHASSITLPVLRGELPRE
jgi:hypothetical protein